MFSMLTKNKKCSLLEEIISEVPQRSILRPLLFNIILCDLFLSFENNYFTNYAAEAVSEQNNIICFRETFDFQIFEIVICN